MCMGTSNWRAMAYSRSISPTFSGVTLPFSFTSTPAPAKGAPRQGLFQTRPGHGVGQLGPLLPGAQGARSPGLPGRKAHIAHTAVHIAQGGQLQTAAAGRGPQSPPNSSFSAAV